MVVLRKSTKMYYAPSWANKNVLGSMVELQMGDTKLTNKKSYDEEFRTNITTLCKNKYKDRKVKGFQAEDFREELTMI